MSTLTCYFYDWIIVLGKFSVEFRGMLGGFSAKNSQLLSVHCTCIKTQNYLNECSLFFGISVILSLLFVMIFFFQGMSVIFQVALGLLKVKHLLV